MADESESKSRTILVNCSDWFLFILSIVFGVFMLVLFAKEAHHSKDTGTRLFSILSSVIITLFLIVGCIKFWLAKSKKNTQAGHENENKIRTILATCSDWFLGILFLASCGSLVVLSAKEAHHDDGLSAFFAFVLCVFFSLLLIAGGIRFSLVIYRRKLPAGEGENQSLTTLGACLDWFLGFLVLVVCVIAVLSLREDARDSRSRKKRGIDIFWCVLIILFVVNGCVKFCLVLSRK